MKKSILTFRNAKEQGTRLSLLTAYDYSGARLVDSCGIDGILVGDSLGMVCLGYKNTLAVTMTDMIHHTKAVSRGVDNALLISDMPFMSYQASIEDAIKNAGRLVQEGGAEAVKLEGGSDVISRIEGIVRAQIPVMGHLGLTPQSINLLGGFRLQGTDADKGRALLDEAKRLEDAGVFAIVLECIPREVAEIISEKVSVPTIGIGSGPGCDGQILVYQDILGLYEKSPKKFIKEFAEIGQLTSDGIKSYIHAVVSGIFPGYEHSYHLPKEESMKLRRKSGIYDPKDQHQ